MATLSFHAGTEGKMTKQNLRKLVSHTFRKMEHGAKDVKPEHGNKMIDVDKTHLNFDVTPKGVPMADFVEATIAERVTRHVRSNSVLAREIIVQASPDVYEGLNEQDRIAKSRAFTLDTFEWMVKEFGAPNVVGCSAHHDETNPHTHFVVVPIHTDTEGKFAGTTGLVQKEFFKGPGDLRRQHKEYREFMNARGWNFDKENKYENVDGMDLHQYKKTAKLVEGKRAEQKKMQEELREDPDLREKVEKEVTAELLLSPKMRQRAIEELKSDEDVRKGVETALRDDLFDSVLLGERNALQAKQKRIDDEIEALKAERKAVSDGIVANETLKAQLREVQAGFKASLQQTKATTVDVVKLLDESVKNAPLKGFAGVKDVTVELVDAYADVRIRTKGKKRSTVNGPVNFTQRDYVDMALKSIAEADKPSTAPGKGAGKDVEDSFER